MTSSSKSATRLTLLKVCLSLFALLITSTSALARECQSGLTASNTTLSRVIDGDTLVTTNRQRVRLIGINALETNSPNAQDRVWAASASAALGQMLANRRITVQTSVDRKDRHGRLLGHLMLDDGSDPGAQLISKGLAIAIAVGNNTACAQENISLERDARTKGLGMWANKGDWWSDNDDRLEATRGFHVIRSQIETIPLRNNQPILMLENGLTVSLGATWPLDDEETTHLISTWEHQHVEVRGWLSGRQHAPELRLHHPANLQLVNR